MTDVMMLEDGKVSAGPFGMHIESECDQDYFMKDGMMHVALVNGVQYRVALSNTSETHRCLVRMKIDGKTMLRGMQLPTDTEFPFERPQDVAKKFTFYETAVAASADRGPTRNADGTIQQKTYADKDTDNPFDTTPLRGSGIRCGQEENGLIEAELIPELLREVSLRNDLDIRTTVHVNFADQVKELLAEPARSAFPHPPRTPRPRWL
eukprot:Sspe_Gene.51::Locus_19_Transcript_1_1_Confidence_1.000_Length_2145::g.51::m.51